MVVTLLYRGLRIAGLHIGKLNAQRYFAPGSTSVELHLDHLTILCPLSPRFWEDHPEIQDARLCGWLEAKFPYRASHRATPHLTLVPAEAGAFRLTSLLPAHPPAPSVAVPDTAIA